LYVSPLEDTREHNQDYDDDHDDEASHTPRERRDDVGCGGGGSVLPARA
jgi:hypothetical protein